METKTLQYVSLSEIFQDCDEILQWFGEHSDLTWGGATFTLTSLNRIAVEVDFAKVYYLTQPEVLDQANLVLQRLSDLPRDTMVDLES
jgi:hypothetical protein